MKQALNYAEQFDANHRSEGGLAMLMSLYEEGLSNAAIARHFKISEQSISYALKKLLGAKYIAYPWRKLLL